ncbi:MAG: type II toxin-antitoxin system RelE/ParE family toxin [Deltaproteobacteria bacterium]|nr:type II toxin-antitoxin system RelE/ParE family toxin [Deltaproteobacteria bacterium]
MRQREASIQICEGNQKSIEAAIRSNGSTPAIEYYQNLPTRDQAKFLKLFERMAEKGQIFNPEKFKLLEDGIFEFKAKPYRILCFMTKDKKVVLTNGFEKQSRKTKSKYLNLAKTIREEYLQVR